MLFCLFPQIIGRTANIWQKHMTDSQYLAVLLAILVMEAWGGHVTSLNQSWKQLVMIVLQNHTFFWQILLQICQIFPATFLSLDNKCDLCIFNATFILSKCIIFWPNLNSQILGLTKTIFFSNLIKSTQLDKVAPLMNYYVFMTNVWLV